MIPSSIAAEITIIIRSINKKAEINNGNWDLMAIGT